MVELLPFSLVAIFQFLSGRRIPGLIWICLLSLIALPLFHLGLYNDLVMRASIPSLLVLMGQAGLFLETFIEQRTRTAWIFALLFFLACGPSFANDLRFALGLQRGFFLETHAEFVQQYEGRPLSGWLKELFAERSSSLQKDPVQEKVLD